MQDELTRLLFLSKRMVLADSDDFFQILFGYLLMQALIFRFFIFYLLMLAMIIRKSYIQNWF